MTKKSTSPLDLFRTELAKLPDSVPTKSVWQQLHYVLTDTNNRVDDLTQAVRGDGNGERGLLARMTNVESAVKVIQSDVRETLNMMRVMTEPVPEPEPEEEDPTPERTWFIEKVLPGLVEKLIIAIVTAVTVLVITHYVH